MAELLPVITGAGGLGALVVWAVYLMANHRSDRAAEAARIKAANDRADEADSRRRTAQDETDATLKRAREAEALAERLQWQLDRLRPPELPPPPPEGGMP